jgi:hypothetical protein
MRSAAWLLIGKSLVLPQFSVVRQPLKSPHLPTVRIASKRNIQTVLTKHKKFGTDVKTSRNARLFWISPACIAGVRTF